MDLNWKMLTTTVWTLLVVLPSVLSEPYGVNNNPLTANFTSSVSAKLTFRSGNEQVNLCGQNLPVPGVTRVIDLPAPNITATASEVRNIPQVQFTGLDPNILYTWMVLEQVDGYEAFGDWERPMVMGLKVNARGGDLSTGTTVVSQDPVSPRRDGKTYMLMLLYRQSGFIGNATILDYVNQQCRFGARCSFGVQQYAEDNGMTLLLASGITVTLDYYGVSRMRLYEPERACRAVFGLQVSQNPLVRDADLKVEISGSYKTKEVVTKPLCGRVFRYMDEDTAVMWSSIAPFAARAVRSLPRVELNKWEMEQQNRPQEAGPDQRENQTKPTEEKKDVLLTLVLVDQTMEGNNSAERPFVNWVVSNIKNHNVGTGNCSVPYLPIMVPKGVRDGTYLLYKQSDHVEIEASEFTDNNMDCPFQYRCAWDINRLVAEKNLTLVGVLPLRVAADPVSITHSVEQGLLTEDQGCRAIAKFNKEGRMLGECLSKFDVWKALEKDLEESQLEFRKKIIIQKMANLCPELGDFISKGKGKEDDSTAESKPGMIGDQRGDDDEKGNKLRNFFEHLKEKFMTEFADGMKDGEDEGDGDKLQRILEGLKTELMMEFWEKVQKCKEAKQKAELMEHIKAKFLEEMKRKFMEHMEMNIMEHIKGQMMKGFPFKAIGDDEGQDDDEKGDKMREFIEHVKEKIMMKFADKLKGGEDENDGDKLHHMLEGLKKNLMLEFSEKIKKCKEAKEKAELMEHLKMKVMEEMKRKLMEHIKMKMMVGFLLKMKEGEEEKPDRDQMTERMGDKRNGVAEREREDIFREMMDGMRRKLGEERGVEMREKGDQQDDDDERGDKLKRDQQDDDDERGDKLRNFIEQVKGKFMAEFVGGMKDGEDEEDGSKLQHMLEGLKKKIMMEFQEKVKKCKEGKQNVELMEHIKAKVFEEMKRKFMEHMRTKVMEHMKGQMMKGFPFEAMGDDEGEDDDEKGDKMREFIEHVKEKIMMKFADKMKGDEDEEDDDKLHYMLEGLKKKIMMEFGEKIKKCKEAKEKAELMEHLKMKVMEEMERKLMEHIKMKMMVGSFLKMKKSDEEKPDWDTMLGRMRDNRKDGTEREKEGIFREIMEGMRKKFGEKRGGEMREKRDQQDDDDERGDKLRKFIEQVKGKFMAEFVGRMKDGEDEEDGNKLQHMLEGLKKKLMMEFQEKVQKCKEGKQKVELMEHIKAKVFEEMKRKFMEHMRMKVMEHMKGQMMKGFPFEAMGDDEGEDDDEKGDKMREFIEHVKEKIMMKFADKMEGDEDEEDDDKLHYMLEGLKKKIMMEFGEKIKKCKEAKEKAELMEHLKMKVMEEMERKLMEHIRMKMMVGFILKMKKGEEEKPDRDTLFERMGDKRKGGTERGKEDIIREIREGTRKKFGEKRGREMREKRDQQDDDDERDDKLRNFIEQVKGKFMAEFVGRMKEGEDEEDGNKLQHMLEGLKKKIMMEFQEKVQKCKEGKQKVELMEHIKAKVFEEMKRKFMEHMRMKVMEHMKGQMMKGFPFEAMGDDEGEDDDEKGDKMREFIEHVKEKIMMKFADKMKGDEDEEDDDKLHYMLEGLKKKIMMEFGEKIKKCKEAKEKAELMEHLKMKVMEEMERKLMEHIRMKMMVGFILKMKKGEEEKPDRDTLFERMGDKRKGGTERGKEDIIREIREGTRKKFGEKRGREMREKRDQQDDDDERGDKLRNFIEQVKGKFMAEFVDRMKEGEDEEDGNKLRHMLEGLKKKLMMEFQEKVQKCKEAKQKVELMEHIKAKVFEEMKRKFMEHMRTKVMEHMKGQMMKGFPFEGMGDDEGEDDDEKGDKMREFIEQVKEKIMMKFADKIKGDEDEEDDDKLHSMMEGLKKKIMMEFGEKIKKCKEAKEKAELMEHLKMKVMEEMERKLMEHIKMKMMVGSFLKMKKGDEEKPDWDTMLGRMRDNRKDGTEREKEGIFREIMEGMRKKFGEKRGGEMREKRDQQDDDDERGDKLRKFIEQVKGKFMAEFVGRMKEGEDEEDGNKLQHMLEGLKKKLMMEFQEKVQKCKEGKQKVELMEHIKAKVFEEMKRKFMEHMRMKVMEHMKGQMMKGFPFEAMGDDEGEDDDEKGDKMREFIEHVKEKIMMKFADKIKGDEDEEDDKLHYMLEGLKKKIMMEFGEKIKKCKEAKEKAELMENLKMKVMEEMERKLMEHIRMKMMVGFILKMKKGEEEKPDRDTLFERMGDKRKGGTEREKEDIIREIMEGMRKKFGEKRGGEMREKRDQQDDDDERDDKLRNFIEQVKGKFMAEFVGGMKDGEDEEDGNKLQHMLEGLKKKLMMEFQEKVQKCKEAEQKVELMEHIKAKVFEEMKRKFMEHMRMKVMEHMKGQMMKGFPFEAMGDDDGEDDDEKGDKMREFIEHVKEKIMMKFADKMEDSEGKEDNDKLHYMLEGLKKKLMMEFWEKIKKCKEAKEKAEVMEHLKMKVMEEMKRKLEEHIKMKMMVGFILKMKEGEEEKPDWDKMIAKMGNNGGEEREREGKFKQMMENMRRKMGEERGEASEDEMKEKKMAILVTAFKNLLAKHMNTKDLSEKLEIVKELFQKKVATESRCPLTGEPNEGPSSKTRCMLAFKGMMMKKKFLEMLEDKAERMEEERKAAFHKMIFGFMDKMDGEKKFEL